MSNAREVDSSTDDNEYAHNIDLDDRVFTVWVAGERFGIPVAHVHTVFMIDEITSVPLAHEAVIGLVNLRGRIVTAVSLRPRLGLEPLNMVRPVAIGIEHRGEALALVVDAAGDVINIGNGSEIEAPRHIPAARAKLTASAFRMKDGLLSILNMDAVFDIHGEKIAA